MAEVTQEMIDYCLETSFDSIRKSVDNTLGVLKFKGEKPETLSPYQDNNHNKIMEIMNTPAWGG